MGRLINTKDIRVKPQYMQDVMGIAMIRCEDLARILADVPTVEAIPKSDYETRLKAEKIAILEELQSEIEEIVKEEELIDKKWANGLHYSEKIIQEKINALRGKEK